ncbi:MAG: hypothetical protein NTY68_05460 [Candidatus Micrarchaeota archaeon]|nr:hypothetical protein [Candidatus Micrarchaeota archaeon]
MSSQLQDKEDVTEIKGKGRFFNPFTGKDPFEEDIKKGLSIEEMKKRLQERSAQEKIKYLETLLSKRGSSLKKGTVNGIEEIISESYRFFGDEMMEKGYYGKAAQSYESANEDELAKKAWKLAGDSQMAAAQAETQPIIKETEAPAESAHKKPKPGESRHGEPGEAAAEFHEEAKKEGSRPENKKAEGPKKKPVMEKEQEERIRISEAGEKGGEEKGQEVKKEIGKRKKSGFATAAEFYENAGEMEMAESAWKLAGDEYLSFSEKDRKYLDDALDSYKKGKNFKMSVYVSLLSGKSTKSIEDLSKKGNLGRKEFVIMANDLLTKNYLHAARFLFNLAGEKDLARKILDMEKKK